MEGPTLTPARSNVAPDAGAGINAVRTADWLKAPVL